MHTAPHHYTTYTKKTNLSCVFISYKIDIILQFWREYFNFRFFYHEFRLLEKFHYIHNKFFTIGREIVNIFFVSDLPCLCSKYLLIKFYTQHTIIPRTHDFLTFVTVRQEFVIKCFILQIFSFSQIM